MLKCIYCGNKDSKYFYFRNERPYCKKCVGFIGEKVNNKTNVVDNYNYELNYKLTKEQNKLSINILKSFKSRKNIHKISRKLINKLVVN